MSQADETGKFELKTPLGSISSSSKRAAELIAALSFAAMLLIGYVVYEHNANAAKGLSELSSGLKDMAAAQRLMACLIALPQERREAEYQSQTGLCKRMEAMK